MPTIQPFRGLRYDPKHVGSLSNVVAPPYDVIGKELQDQLYKAHPANVIRLILNRDEPGDNESNNRYTRAAKFLKNWRAEGVLTSEPDPAVYVYHQMFRYGDQEFTRRGFMARCRLERFGEGRIYPHEETLSGPKADRLLLMRACRANLSQIFGLYPDPQSTAQNLLETAVAKAPPLEATDHLGVVHRMWPLADPKIASELSGEMQPHPIFIADGHHRYETACNYRDELAAAAGGSLPPEHPANFVLMMFISMSDPGLIVMPTHRLFRGLPKMSSSELIEKLGPNFTTRIAGEGSDLAPTIWNEIEADGDQGTLGLYTAADQRWVVARLTDAGRRRMAEVASERSADWQGLGVALLHRLVVDTLLAAKDLPKPRYVHLVEEVVEGVETDEFPLAALVMPATVEHIRRISQHGERMPAKSTYFYPKLLSGLVINPLE
ncbi:MAG TPA: DUF1015 domain-containing protein [Pirellulales bacterium]|nr:DUF1015 domain-containing protein [Pirellulales bacterium]